MNEILIFFPIVILLILFLKNFKKFDILFIVILTLIFFYFENILFAKYIFSLFFIQKSLSDKNLRNNTIEMFRDVFYLKTHYKNLPKQPTIFVANYPQNYYETFAFMLIPTDLSVILAPTKYIKYICDRIVSKTIFGGGRREVGKSSYEHVKDRIKCSLEKNISVIGYCNKPRKMINMRTGLFRIAKELNVTITPIVFDTIDVCNFQILKQNFQIYVGKSFYVSDIEKDVKNVKKIFKDKVKEFKKTKYQRDINVC